MTKKSANRDSRALFGAKFTEQFQKWKNAGKDRTQSSFGQLLDPPASRVSVSKWCSGKDIPTPERLEQICDIFGVPEEYFDTDNMTHDQKYQYSSVYMTKLGQKHVKFSNMIGLDLDLIRVLSRLVDFDTLFPLYSPIEHTTIDPDTGEKIYDREVVFSQSAPMEDEDIDEDLRFLQIEKDGKRITLHRCDLAFLKELQDQVVALTEGVLYHRAKQMEEETEAWNRDLETEVLVDGKPVHGSERIKYLKDNKDLKVKGFDSPEAFKEAWSKNSKSKGQNICLKHKEPTPDFIREHDRFAHYNYVFPDRPEEDWVSIYKEVKEGTQEDIDKFSSAHKGEREVKLVGGGIGIVKEGE